MKIIDNAYDGATSAFLEIEPLASTVTIEARWCQPLGPDSVWAEYVFLVFNRRRALLVAWAIIKAALTFRRFQ